MEYMEGYVLALGKRSYFSASDKMEDWIIMKGKLS